MAQHAEPEAREFLNSGFPQRSWQAILTVPLYGEDHLLEQFLRHLKAAATIPVLVIFIVNEREDSPEAVYHSNARSLNILTHAFPQNRWQRDMFSLGHDEQISALVVDRSTTRPLPSDQGVGLARKIIGDIGVALWHEGLCSHPWISCCDADVIPHRDYFIRNQALAKHRNAAAVVHAYAHIPAPGQEDALSWEALQQYELWLRFYMRGLVAARSPYHYTAIGSMISFHAERYAGARGFPKRQAGEDFYLLNKLRKLGDVYDLAEPEQRIMDRPSDRVPFGTGVGTQKILDQSSRGEQYAMYDPRIFKVLHLCLKSVRHMRDGASASSAEAELHASLHRELPNAIAAGCYNFFWQKHRIPEQWESACRRSRNVSGAWREFNGWFDAFRTLRFVHTLRDTYLPNRPWRDALLQAPFLVDAALNPNEPLTVWVEKVRRAPFGIFE